MEKRGELSLPDENGVAVPTESIETRTPPDDLDDRVRQKRKARLRDLYQVSMSEVETGETYSQSACTIDGAAGRLRSVPPAVCGKARANSAFSLGRADKRRASEAPAPGGGLLLPLDAGANKEFTPFLRQLARSWRRSRC